MKKYRKDSKGAATMPILNLCVDGTKAFPLSADSVVKSLQPKHTFSIFLSLQQD